jgi:hypothetical protein
MIVCVPRKIFLGIRINPELKNLLEEIGKLKNEVSPRFASCSCERGTDAYKKAGPKYLQRLRSSEKKRSSE